MLEKTFYVRLRRTEHSSDIWKQTETKSLRLAHDIGALALGLATLLVGLESVLDLDVQVSSVSVVGLAEKSAVELLASLDGEVVVEVEDGLLPMRVLCVGAGRELDGLVAGREFNVEPGDQGVDVVGAADRERVGKVECEIGNLAGIEVERNERCGIGDDSLEVNSVDEGLGESGALEGGVVEAPDVVPDCNTRSAHVHDCSNKAELTVDLLLLVVAVLDTSNKDGGLVGEDQTALLEVAVTGPQNSVQHGLVEQEVAHPLGNDNVDLGERQNNLLHLALQKSDLVAQAVDLDNLLGLVNDGRHVDTCLLYTSDAADEL